MLSPSVRFHCHIAVLQQRHQFAGWSMSDNTSTVEDPTKRELFEFEKRKFEEEQSIKRDSLDNERPNDAFGFFKSPLGLAIIGGLVTILVNSASSYFSRQNTLDVEREKLQADLIKKYLEAPEKKAREDNLKFLAGAGLIPAYGKRIEDYLKSNPDAIPHTPISSDYKTFGDPNILSGTVLDKIAAIRNSLVVVRLRQGAVEWRKCTGVLIDQTTVVTMSYCAADNLAVPAAGVQNLKVDPGKGNPVIDVKDVRIVNHGSSAESIALVTLTAPASNNTPLQIETASPSVGLKLILPFVDGRTSEFYASVDEDCKITNLKGASGIGYRCDGDVGSAGAPIVSMETGRILGVHSMATQEARWGVRLTAADVGL
ncbi:trypsin-like serine protease [Rhizobium leguminosarum bv. viciae]|uniref:Serine protease n=2 Tax=Rhizobium/Agrobacterium group TaxID=227290 RepID=A0A8G2IRJ6_RHILV|nr:trypsin-like serine protease [Rhizobium leguminosarum bv. viciae]NKK25690.1 trypsin-like serine protease [Rhizobium leguminosarum bv. viciae]TBX84192.1 trypsin-like serine protease [Rhizobium leguminosarum bv. viciae]TBZ07497.1 trypsin-like serine protease [Rhizobium leguminosarum bv. viciae]